MTDQNTRPTPSSDVAELIERLRTRAQYANFTDRKGEAKIMHEAAAALSALSASPAQVEVTDEISDPNNWDIETTADKIAREVAAIKGGRIHADWYATAKQGALAALRIAKAAAFTATDAKPVHPKTIDCRSPVEHAIVEYHLVDNLAGEAEKMGRHSAIRGMMVRLGMYDEFVRALEAGDDYEPPLQDAKPVVPAEPVAEFRTDADDYIDNLNVLCEDFGCKPGADRLHWLHERLSRAEMADEALRSALAVHGDQYSWGAQARAALASEGKTDA